jgi:predicted RNA-binding Zn-ribbon protein involved in translation (DUF1610 family)
MRDATIVNANPDIPISAAVSPISRLEASPQASAFVSITGEFIPLEQKPACPECGSTRLFRAGMSAKCRSCGAVFTPVLPKHS